MTPEEKKIAKEKDKKQQMGDVVRLLGAKHPEMVKQYQHIFLKNANGRAVLKEILRDTKVFAIKLTDNDLPLRNYGMNLLLTTAGAHLNPQTLESLFGMFIDALAEYERKTAPTD